MVQLRFGHPNHIPQANQRMASRPQPRRGHTERTGEERCQLRCVARRRPILRIRVNDPRRTGSERQTRGLPTLMRVCSTPGCGTIYPRAEGSRCPQHRAQADKARGTATNRGYNSRGHQAFRAGVLLRDPICVLCSTAQSTVADHYPLSRKQLLDAGMDPNNPDAGRGLCATCHNRETAHHQPGGWHTPH